MTDSSKRKIDIYFQMAQGSDLSQVVELFSDAFRNDPLMQLFNPQGKSPIAFRQSLFSVITRGYFREHLCFIGTLDGELIAAALVKKKNVPELNFFSYARSGGARLIKCLGIKSFVQFLKTYDQVLADCHHLDANAWYLESIAVNQAYQGIGIGGKMLQDCLIPYIAQNDGGLLTLVTQNANNQKFYQSNGFIQFATNHVVNENCEVASFSFKQEIAKR